MWRGCPTTSPGREIVGVVRYSGEHELLTHPHTTRSVTFNLQLRRNVRAKCVSKAAVVATHLCRDDLRVNAVVGRDRCIRAPCLELLLAELDRIA